MLSISRDILETRQCLSLKTREQEAAMHSHELVLLKMEQPNRPFLLLFPTCLNFSCMFV